MQEVENTAEDGQQQQREYDHHYDHSAALSYTHTHTQKDKSHVSVNHDIGSIGNSNNLKDLWCLAIYQAGMA